MHTIYYAIARFSYYSDRHGIRVERTLETKYYERNHLYAAKAAIQWAKDRYKNFFRAAYEKCRISGIQCGEYWIGTPHPGTGKFDTCPVAHFYQYREGIHKSFDEGLERVQEEEPFEFSPFLRDVDVVLPVEKKMTHVYYQIIDAEGSLVCFLGMSERDSARADFIVNLLNGEQYRKEHNA